MCKILSLLNLFRTALGMGSDFSQEPVLLLMSSEDDILPFFLESLTVLCYTLAPSLLHVDHFSLLIFIFAVGSEVFSLISGEFFQ
jgi:hypothetical protein